MDRLEKSTEPPSAADCSEYSQLQDRENEGGNLPPDGSPSLEMSDGPASQGGTSPWIIRKG